MQFNIAIKCVYLNYMKFQLKQTKTQKTNNISTEGNTNEDMKLNRITEVERIDCYRIQITNKILSRF